MSAEDIYVYITCRTRYRRLKESVFIAVLDHHLQGGFRIASLFHGRAKQFVSVRAWRCKFSVGWRADPMTHARARPQATRFSPRHQHVRSGTSLLGRVGPQMLQMPRIASSRFVKRYVIATMTEPIKNTTEMRLMNPMPIAQSGFVNIGRHCR